MMARRQLRGPTEAQVAHGVMPAAEAISNLRGLGCAQRALIPSYRPKESLKQRVSSSLNVNLKLNWAYN